MENGNRDLRLLYAVLVKGLLDLLLLVGIVGYAARANFPPSIRGAIDLAGPERVAGWAIDAGDPGTVVAVQLFIDGRFSAAGIANTPRPDLVPAGVAPDPNHGFSFTLDSSPDRGPGISGQPQIEVFVLHEALNGNRTLIPLPRPPASGRGSEENK
jgi:hypothetical protein